MIIGRSRRSRIAHKGRVVNMGDVDQDKTYRKRYEHGRSRKSRIARKGRVVNMTEVGDQGTCDEDVFQVI